MATITISREMGSEGANIGRQVAQKLGYDFVDKNTIEKVLRQYGLTKFSDVYTSAPSFWDLLDPNNLLIVSMLNETMEALAYRDNVVILGRGGFAGLSDYADVLNVRIQSPFPARVQRVIARENLTNRAQAEERVREDDKARHKFIQMFYDKQWDQEANFNLVIDIESVSIDMAVNWIVDATRALEQKALGKEVVTTKSIEVDPVLADAIVEAMANPLPALPD